MDNEDLKVVLFDKYCKTCKHCDRNENTDPCELCLDEPVRLYSEKPFYYQEKDESTTKQALLNLKTTRR